ncbi:MFS transporter [Streptomyces verrucosisporus]|uniref:MFS transporter n=1 Tax=Streptomyces verrucosisporus TaxID=1695161 RepID=UPI0019D07888|nr:MFS transporter [Streptomyces verrucosisporus]MBN3930192.1 MFS transporter [Streptomyces verrucosisporus]
MSGTTTAGATRAADVPRQRPRRTGTAGPGGGSPEPGGGASRWTVLVVLCASLLLVAVDATVLHVAVPAVSQALRPGAIELLWIVDAYPLVCASLLILFGTLGDRVGRRRVLLCGYAVFGAASALAAYAHTPEVLIAARALLGIGGAMIMPATLSILRQVFPDRRERALAIGVWSAVAAVGAAVGPLVGGLLLEHFWWGSVFLVNIPLMLLCIPLGRRLLPESTGDRDGPWDVVGALVAAAGLGALILGVKRAGGGEALHPGTLVPLVLGAALLALFVRRQLRRRHPLVDCATLARPAFGTAVACIVLTVLALVGLALIAAQYLQLVLGLTPLQTGLRLLPLSLAAIAAGLAGSRMLRRLGPRLMVLTGFLLTAAAVLALTGVGLRDEPALLVCGFVVLGFGLETTLFGAYESMLSEAPAHQAGGAAAIGETAYQLGAGMGIAVLGTVMNAAYAPGVRGATGVPEAAGEDAVHSLGAAYEVAERLGGPAGRALREAARESFVHGLHVALLVSAGLLLLGALAALRLPRAMGAPGQDGGLDKAQDRDRAQDRAQEQGRGPDEGSGERPAKEPDRTDRDGAAPARACASPGPAELPGQPGGPLLSSGITRP